MPSLYGAPRPSRPAPTADTSFSTALSSLISSSTSTTKTPTTTSRPSKRPLSSRDSIFTSHHRSQKRFRTSPNASTTQTHSTTTAPTSNEDWALSRKRLEKKARLYKAMQRGDLDDSNEKYAVDFDRKWADSTSNPSGSGAVEDGSEGSDAESGSEGEEQIEYTDEFGRTRVGSKLAALIASHASTLHPTHPTTTSHPSRPPAPSKILHGDTIQHLAFDPETADMAALAGKRDRTPTPPPVSRYDASAEIRKRGTGFFAFSRDEGERGRQMGELERERGETERVRAARGSSPGGGGGGKGGEGGEEGEGARRRREQLEERRKVIRKVRERKEADRFLRELDSEAGGGVGMGVGGRFVRGAED